MKNRGDYNARRMPCARRGLLAGAILAVLSLAGTAQALLVDLDAYVAFPILSSDGVTPIADGSWVFIYGSGDAVQDPMNTVGTNVIAGTATGDDVILGSIQLPLNVGTNSGMFFVTVQYESDDINYTYIRFFDTPGALTGQLAWGTSDIYQLGVTLGVATVQYDPGTNLITSRTNNFVIIPEPSTANLFIVVAGMMWAMRIHRRGAIRRRELAGDDDADDEQDGSRDVRNEFSPAADNPGVPAPGCLPETLYSARAGPPGPVAVMKRQGWPHQPPPPPS